MDSAGKTIEKKFGYVETDGFRNWKYEYPNENITLTKEFFKSNSPEKITELKLIPEENKKVLTKKYLFPASETKEIFYHDSLGNLYNAYAAFGRHTHHTRDVSTNYNEPRTF